MADNERQAEIEAVRQALCDMVFTDMPDYGGDRREAAEAVMAALDPARDARHDDEAWPANEVEAMERALLEHLDEDDAMTAIQILRPWLAARSPQGEDHEMDDPAMPYPHGMPWFEDAKDDAIEEHDGLPGYWVCERCGQPLSADGRCNSGLHVGPGEDANGMAIHTTDLAALAVSARDARHGTPTVEDIAERLRQAAAAEYAQDHHSTGDTFTEAADFVLAEFAPDDTPHPTDPAPAPDKENR